MQKNLDIITKKVDNSRANSNAIEPAVMISLEDSSISNLGGRAVWIGNHNALLGATKTIALWSTKQNRVLGSFMPYGKMRFGKSAVSKDGKYIATSADKEEGKLIAINIWDAKTLKFIKALEAPTTVDNPTAWNIVFSNDSKKIIAIFSRQGKRFGVQEHFYIAQYDVLSGVVISSTKVPGRAIPGTPFASSLDGNMAVTMSHYYAKKERTLNIHDFVENTIRQKKLVSGKKIVAYRYSKSNPKTLLLGGVTTTFKPGTNIISSKSATLWRLNKDTLAMEEIYSFPLNIFIKFVDFAIDEEHKMLLIAYDNRVVDIYNYSSGQLIKSVNTTGNNLYAIDYRPDTKELLVAAGDRVLVYRVSELISDK